MNGNHITSCTISDLISWNERGELEISPKYQRNSVWNENAKSYLMDTIFKGLPIPPIFIRSSVDINTKMTTREVLDGQQRIRTILSFINNEFTIKKSHNNLYGNVTYSELDDEKKSEILNYDISVEYITERDDSVVYDMFARLNSNNYVLNKQEIRNAKYWGDFKVLAYSIASENRDFFLQYSIMNDKDCTRMRDVELINSILILQIEGLVTESQSYIDSIYRKYESAVPNMDKIKTNTRKCMQIIEKIYEFCSGNITPFNNKNYFFSLFMVLYNQMYGIPNLNSNLVKKDEYNVNEIDNNIPNFINCITRFIYDYNGVFIDKNSYTDNYEEIKKFDIDNRNRTTNKDGRIRRISFLTKYLDKY